mgnify:CR=1 FL=1
MAPSAVVSIAKVLPHLESGRTQRGLGLANGHRALVKDARCQDGVRTRCGSNRCHGGQAECGADLVAGVHDPGCEAAYLGMNASVREGVRIGADATVGMGSVVLDDVPAGETWVGVPARPIRTGVRL